MGAAHSASGSPGRHEAVYRACGLDANMWEAWAENRHHGPAWLISGGLALSVLMDPWSGDLVQRGARGLWEDGHPQKGAGAQVGAGEAGSQAPICRCSPGGGCGAVTGSGGPWGCSKNKNNCPFQVRVKTLKGKKAPKGPRTCAIG